MCTAQSNLSVLYSNEATDLGWATSGDAKHPSDHTISLQQAPRCLKNIWSDCEVG
jgi:hypothetical protein